jgi:chromosomal replication initiation ATPase DnaA
MSPEAKEWVDREFWMLRQRVADLERVVTQIVEADVSGIDSATARRIEQVRDRMRATDVVNGAGRERVAAVVREIAARYGVPEKALYGKQHKTAPRELLRARNMALRTVYRRYGYTFSMLARLFGLGQHTTVARAIESAEEQCA